MTYRLITTEQELLGLVDFLQEPWRVALDIETCPMDDTNSALDPRRGRVRLISVAAKNDIGGVVDVTIVDPTRLLDVLQGKTLIAHNASFDLSFLWNQFGYEHDGPVIDTRLLSQLLEGQHPRVGSHSLQSVARRELGIELDKEHQTADWGGELSPAMLQYAAMDAQVLLPLAEALVEKVRDAGLERVMQIEQRALPAMAWMENAGVPFDAEGWREHLKRVEDDIYRLKGELDAVAPDHPDGGEWNWNSPNRPRRSSPSRGSSF